MVPLRSICANSVRIAKSVGDCTTLVLKGQPTDPPDSLMKHLLVCIIGLFRQPSAEAVVAESSVTRVCGGANVAVVLRAIGDEIPVAAAGLIGIDIIEM